MKKIISLFITIFALFIGINSVLASEAIGTCTYYTGDASFGADGSAIVTIYSDGSAKVTFPQWGIDGSKNIEEPYKGILQKGTCYNYMYDNNSLTNKKVTFSNDATMSGTKYSLAANNTELSCYYDIKGFNDGTDDTWARILVQRKPKGSRTYVYVLNSDNTFKPLVSGEKVVFYHGKLNSDSTVTYDLSSSIPTYFDFLDEIDLFNVMNGSTCPKLYYEKQPTGGGSNMIHVIPNPSDTYALSFANANNSYKTVTDSSNPDNPTSTVDDTASDGIKENIICEKNGKISIEDKNLTFNFKFMKDDDGYKWCIEIDTSYQCISAEDDYNQALSLSSDDINTSYPTVKFMLDSDLFYYFQGIRNGTRSECPNYIGTDYSSTTGAYMLSNDPAHGTNGLEDGRNLDTGGTRQTEVKQSHLDPTDPGSTEYTCEGLIGENVLKFLTVVFGLIRLVGPILALVLGMYDLFMAMVNGEDDAKKKALKKLKGRIIAAVLLLILPYLLDLLLHLVDKAGTNCIPH